MEARIVVRAPHESTYGKGKEGEPAKDRDVSIDPVGGARCCFALSTRALAPTGTAANCVRACSATQRVHNRINVTLRNAVHDG